ncbi:MAG: hypothetical protein AAFQ82_15060, partial [Myxococcota bacterium]
VTDSDEPAPKPDEALGEAEASDETGQASGEDEPNEDVDNETHTDAAGDGLEEAPEPDEEEQRGALIPVSFSRRTIQWRIDYDRSLRSNDSLSEANEGEQGSAESAASQGTPRESHTYLDAAIDAFLADPTPSNAPELARFIRAAETRALESEDPQRAWHIMEHARLLELQPSDERRGRASYPKAWRDTLAARGTEAYTLDSASALVRALEGAPAQLDAVRAVLGGDSVLLQAFAVGERWSWYAIGAERFEHFETGAVSDSLPAEITAWLKGHSELKTVYVDLGELLELPVSQLMVDKTMLGDRYEVAEVLSATYFLASYEARNLNREPIQRFEATAEDDSLPDATSVLGFEGSPARYGDQVRAGEAQIVLSLPGDRSVDLDGIATLSVSPQAMVFGQIESAREARLLAHAALVAGSSATLTLPNALGDTLEKLEPVLDDKRIATVVQTLG